MRSSLSVLAVLLLSVPVALSLPGCLQPIQGEEGDAGVDAGNGSDSGQPPHSKDGGDLSGEDGGTDKDGGSPPADGGDGGESGQDGGVVALPIIWGKMVVPQTSGLYAISGTSRGNVYAVGSNGVILHYDGSAWTQVTKSPGNLDLRSVYVAPDGAVFAVGGTQAVSCRTGCNNPGQYTWSTVGADLTGVCGRDAQTVYATGIGGSAQSSNAGVLFKYDSAQGNWTRITSDTSSYFNNGCWVASNGTAWLAAQSTVVRYQGGLFTKETVNFPTDWDVSTISLQLFEAVWGSSSGGALFAAGYRRGIIARNANGTWDYQQPATGVDDYHALAGTSATDVVVGGSYSGDNKELRVYDGSAWTTPASLPDENVFGLYAADAKTYFAAGEKSAYGVIWMGSRE